MIFDPDAECPLRTDESLANQDDKKHHEGVSPFLQIDTKLSGQWPIDPMHNVSGVTKRICQFLFSRKKNVSKVVLKPAVFQDLSEHLNSLKPYYASEFNRKLRPLTHYPKFKASEYFRLALYDSFYLFKDLECKKISKVLLLFGCAIRLLSDEDFVGRYRRDADFLLRTFVKESSKLLGILFATFNVHCLIHLPDETARHSSLIKFSAWKYESYLGQIKRMLRAPGNTLQQIVCRIIEKRKIFGRNQEETLPGEAISVSQPHTNGPTVQPKCEDQQFKALDIRDLGKFRTESANDVCFVANSGEVCVLRNIVRNKGEISLVCQAFLETDDFFTYPFR